MGINAAFFDSLGQRDGTRHIEPVASQNGSIWDEAKGVQLDVGGLTTLVGNGRYYDGECVRLNGPGGWHLCVPVAAWAELGFPTPD